MKLDTVLELTPSGGELIIAYGRLIDHNYRNGDYRAKLGAALATAYMWHLRKVYTSKGAIILLIEMSMHCRQFLEAFDV